MTQPLSQSRLQEVLHYNPVTGDFTWLERRPGISVDALAGSISSKGYRRIYVDNRQYKAHHLAWLYMTGQWPKCQVDHKDTCPANNAWNNLRQASNQENSFNRTHPNPNGLKGVSWKKRNKKWVAQISRDGKKVHLGMFATPEEAHAAYCKASKDLHGEFGNTGVK